MHSFGRHQHSESGEASAKEARGLILNGGWRHDLMTWFVETFLFRGKLRELRQGTADLARIDASPVRAYDEAGCGLRHRNAGDRSSAARWRTRPRLRR